MPIDWGLLSIANDAATLKSWFRSRLRPATAEPPRVLMILPKHCRLFEREMRAKTLLHGLTAVSSNRRNESGSAARHFAIAIVALCIAGLLIQPVAADEEAHESVQGPLTAEDSLRHFQLAPGLRIELVAAEPEVVDPVAIRFDEEGRLWVVEMGDYPNGPPRGAAPLSRLKCLEDTDGDGRFETARVFADQLPFATGVQPWHAGAIVTYSGRISWLKDTDDDGRADLRENWFTGFAEENPQLRANHPTFALDNQIYVANGLRGGVVTSTWGRGRREIPISGRDFRFEPLRGTAEAVSGNGQFGLTFDDFGNRFVCSNRNPLVQIMLEERYLARNPLLAVPAVVHDVAAAGDASRVFPISQAWTTSILHAGQFTAACGAEIYRGDALPERFRGNGFTCEPTGNLVHCEVLEPVGATFKGHAEREGVEFLASPDTWFRPVNLETGPDGALYVVDMYRAVIEHPQFVPDELKNRPDLRWGDDRGRIYRIVASDWRRPPPGPKLDHTNPPAIAKQLLSKNAWWRETAARLLYERQNRQARPAVERLAREARDPAARVQVLWLLAGWGELSPATLKQALDDPHPRVREAAVLLSESRLAETPALRRRVIELASDADARLRFQVALSLGFALGDDLVGPLAGVALDGAADVWTRRAVLLSLGDRPGKLLAALLGRQMKSPQLGENELALIAETAHLVGARHEKQELIDVLKTIGAWNEKSSRDSVQLVALSAMARGARSRGIAWPALIERLAASPDAGKIARRIVERAVATVGRHDADATVRLQACQLLAAADASIAVPALVAVVENETDQPLRLAAIGALAEQNASSVADSLLKVLPGQTPAVRHALVDALLARPERTGRLLDELAAKRIKPAELAPLQTQRLLQHPDERLRARAVELLGSRPADRAKLLADYRPSLDAAADPERGREVFKKNCATCHRIGKLGVDVAPSIADSRTKTPEQLLTDILDPSRALDSNYVSYSIATTDGRSLVGIIAAETSSSITLKQPEGKEVSLPRADIEELHSNGVSLMPEGMEKAISVAEMADLISFIKNWRYLEADLPARAGATGP